VAVASAGPYASLHLAPQTDNHTSTPPLSFLQAGCPSCRPTNSVKALKALPDHLDGFPRSVLLRGKRGEEKGERGEENRYGERGQVVDATAAASDLIWS